MLEPHIWRCFLWYHKAFLCVYLFMFSWCVFSSFSYLHDTVIHTIIIPDYLFLLNFCQFAKYGNKAYHRAPKVLSSVLNSKCLFYPNCIKSTKMMILLNSLIMWLIHIELNWRKINLIFFIWISKWFFPHLLFVQFLFWICVCLTFDFHS